MDNNDNYYNKEGQMFYKKRGSQDMMEMLDKIMIKLEKLSESINEIKQNTIKTSYGLTDRVINKGE